MLKKTIAYSLLCIAVSLFIRWFVSYIGIASFSIENFFIAAGIPTLIAPPIIYFLLYKNDQLHRANIEIKRLYNNLHNEIIVREQTEKELKTISGLLPICASCKNIRDDKGYWQQLETYLEKHTDARFSHGLCDKCMEKHYSHEDWWPEKGNVPKKNN